MSPKSISNKLLLTSMTVSLTAAVSPLHAKTHLDILSSTITAPKAITLTTDLPVGIPIENSQIVKFLASATASNGIGHKLIVTHDAPVVFNEGTTSVTFSAVDSTGKTVSASTQVTVALAE